MQNRLLPRGFTLIELLIVVAIIAILAAIAVPNFLEAQTRAKVSRAKSDMRTLAVGIESYYVDNNRFPGLKPRNANVGGGGLTAGISPLLGGNNIGISSRFIVLTTPISYITSIFSDPFVPPQNKYAKTPAAGGPAIVPANGYDGYDYVEAYSLSIAAFPISPFTTGDRASSVSSGAAWHIVSAGPDQINAFGGGVGVGSSAGNYAAAKPYGADYDPTNGTVSSGDVVRVGGGPGNGSSTGQLPLWDRVKGTCNGC